MLAFKLPSTLRILDIIAAAFVVLIATIKLRFSHRHTHAHTQRQPEALTDLLKHTHEYLKQWRGQYGEAEGEGPVSVE